MKIFLIFIFIFPIIIMANETPDIITMASSKKCGKVSCKNNQVCIKSKCYYICSEEYHRGVCKGPEIACNEGECSAICSNSNPNGPCKDITKECINGECIDKSCSEDRPNGLCEVGYICEKGNCVDNSCSKDRPNGVCEKDKECDDGKCEESGGCSYSTNSTSYIYTILFFAFYFLIRRKIKKLIKVNK